MKKVLSIPVFLFLFSMNVLAQNSETTSGASQPAYLSATMEDIGKVIDADGNMYKDLSEAVKANKKPVAVIVYIGTESDCSHGLALAFSSLSGEKFYNEAIEAAANHKPVVPGGVWRLPTPYDLQNILLANGAEGKLQKNLPKYAFKLSCTKLRSILYKSGGQSSSLGSFWLAQEYRQNPELAWQFKLGDYNAEFFADEKGFGSWVWPVLAF